MVGIIDEMIPKLTSLDQNLQECIYVSFAGGQSFLKKVVCKRKEKKKEKVASTILKKFWDINSDTLISKL